MFIGLDEPAPDFGGNGTFTVDPAAPAASLLSGSVVAGRFTGGPGRARLELVVMPGAAPVALDLISARVAADVTASGCTNAKIGGGVHENDIVGKIYPAIAQGINVLVAADPGCPSACGAQASMLLNLFDANDNGTVTTE